MKAKIDMHTHSTASDGDLNSSELLSYAKEKGITTMSLTDHDSIKGIKSLTEKDKENIEFYNGVELTAKVTRGRMHILGYGINTDSYIINDILDAQQEVCIESVKNYINCLKEDYKIVFSEKDINNILTSNKNIGRPDIAHLCVKYGYTKSIDEAFDKYLNDVYAKVRTKNKGLTPKECINLIKSADGIPVIAHPHSLELSSDQLKNRILELKDYGLEGIEVYHSHHNETQRQLYLLLAKRLRLLISGGTDYHGHSVKPDIEIGTGKDNNINISKLSLVNKLRNR